MLNLSGLLDVDEWVTDRKQHAFRVQNASKLLHFNKLLMSNANRYKGTVCYFAKVPDKSVRYLSYNEGTPIFHLFKLVPQNYFIDTFETFDFWKKEVINEENINRILSYNLYKYELPSTPFTYTPGYYLYVCTSVFSIDKLPIIKLAKWAKEYRKRVIIRLGTALDVFDKKNEYDLLISLLRAKGITETMLIVDKTSHINDLVDNCKMMWSAASGVGVAALLKGKPTSYFLKDCDHSYGPIARFTTEPEEAFSDNHILDYDTVKKYFSWYYRVIAADTCNPNIEETIDRRMYNYFMRNYTVEEMLQ